jgi:transcriptional repressor of dcmA and dcmR
VDSKLLNTAEAARFLRVSEASIRRWSDAGLLPGRRVGRRRERRFTEADLLEYLRRDATTASPPPAQGNAINVSGATVQTPAHLATYYSTDAGALRLTAPFLADGLRSSQPCFLVAAGANVQACLDASGHEHGVDLKAAIETGQLTIVRFDGGTSDEVIEQWQQLFAHALSRGAKLIRLVGEMAYVRTMFTSEDEMLRFEEAFDVMLKRYPVVAVCQYDVREFDGEAILRSLKTHPDLFGLRLGTFLN